MLTRSVLWAMVLTATDMNYQASVPVAFDSRLAAALRLHSHVTVSAAKWDIQQRSSAAARSITRPPNCKAGNTHMGSLYCILVSMKEFSPILRLHGMRGNT